MRRALKNQPASLSFTLLLGVLIALAALGTDLYVPALPAVAESFRASVDAAQLTLTTFFAGFAAGQVLWGPLSDRFGRKPVLAAGLTVALGAALAAALGASVAQVAAARFVQGIGMASGVLLGRAIVRDLYSHEQAAALLARMTIVFSVVPIAAPVAGAGLAAALGWRAVFWCHAALCALLLAASLAMLRETAPPERASIRPGAIARTFAAILAERRFLAPFLVMLCSQIGILAFVANSAFTLVRGMGVSTLAYGLMFTAVMLGQIGGAWASSRLVRRAGIARMLARGTAIVLGAGAAAAALAWAGVQHWAAVVLPFMAFLFGSALIIPNAIAAALTPFPAAAGAASSLMGAIAFALGAALSSLLAALFDGTARPMASTAALAGTGAFLFHRMLPGGKA
jgi:DHA1 family bicyclomycin/chloramphenicol resistance-like MFS transporter